MERMSKNCNKLKSIFNIQNINRNNVRDTYKIISNCNYLNELHLNHCNTSILIKKNDNLKDLDILNITIQNNFDNNKLIFIEKRLNNFNFLFYLNLIRIKLEKKRKINSIFNNSKNLIIVLIDNFYIKNLDSIEKMFYKFGILLNNDLDCFKNEYKNEISNNNLDKYPYYNKTNNFRMKKIFNFCIELNQIDLDLFKKYSNNYIENSPIYTDKMNKTINFYLPEIKKTKISLFKI